jgi:hypothetical protein
MLAVFGNHPKGFLSFSVADFGTYVGYGVDSFRAVWLVGGDRRASAVDDGSR